MSLIYPFLRRVHRITLYLWSRLAVPHGKSIIFFEYKLIAAENGNLASALCRTSTTKSFQARHDAPQTVHPACETIRFVKHMLRSFALRSAPRCIQPHDNWRACARMTRDALRASFP
jgi:hypothetical protein